MPKYVRRVPTVGIHGHNWKYYYETRKVLTGPAGGSFVPTGTTKVRTFGRQATVKMRAPRTNWGYGTAVKVVGEGSRKQVTFQHYRGDRITSTRTFHHITQASIGRFRRVSNQVASAARAQGKWVSVRAPWGL